MNMDEEALYKQTHGRVSESIKEGAIEMLCRPLNRAANLIAEWNEVQGFWASNNTGEKIALMHSELSEALDADRNSVKHGHPVMCTKLGLEHLTGVEEELADVLIRVLDFAGHHKLNLGTALRDKLLFNLTRPYMHGKKY